MILVETSTFLLSFITTLCILLNQLLDSSFVFFNNHINLSRGYKMKEIYFLLKVQKKSKIYITIVLELNLLTMLIRAISLIQIISMFNTKF